MESTGSTNSSVPAPSQTHGESYLSTGTASSKSDVGRFFTNLIRNGDPRDIEKLVLMESQTNSLTASTDTSNDAQMVAVARVQGENALRLFLDKLWENIEPHPINTRHQFTFVFLSLRPDLVVYAHEQQPKDQDGQIEVNFRQTTKSDQVEAIINLSSLCSTIGFERRVGKTKGIKPVLCSKWQFHQPDQQDPRFVCEFEVYW